MVCGPLPRAACGTYLLLAEKARRFATDPDIAAALAEASVAELAEPTVGAYSAKAAADLAANPGDPTASLPAAIATSTSTSRDGAADGYALGARRRGLRRTGPRQAARDSGRLPRSPVTQLAIGGVDANGSRVARRRRNAPTRLCAWFAPAKSC